MSYSSNQYRNTMGRLCEDLVTNILLCLPTKYVVRFRCLSKFYNQLVTDPRFATNHDLLSTPEVHGLFRFQGNAYKPDIDNSTLFCSFHSNPKICKAEPKIFLILYSNHHNFLQWPSSSSFSKSMFCVYNPIASPRFKNTIPKPESFKFDEEDKAWNLGLAYDPIRFSSTEFKLVFIYIKETMLVPGDDDDEELNIFGFEIFSSTKNSWRKCESEVTCDGLNDFLDLGQAVNLNGILHWFMNFCEIITFDVKKEEAKVITVPRELEREWFEGQYPYKSWFGAAKGLIYVIYVLDTEEIRIWVLIDYEKKRWEFVRKKIGGLPSGARPVFFDGERLIFNCGRNNNKLHSFDMKLEEWKKMGRFPSGIRDEVTCHHFPSVYIPFIPTLAPVNSITPASLVVSHHHMMLAERRCQKTIQNVQVEKRRQGSSYYQWEIAGFEARETQ